MPITPEREQQARLIESALAGDESSAAAIRNRETTLKLEHILMNRGANATEAGDLVADLWADCFGRTGGRPPLLEKFQGTGNLEAFLTRTALNRLIDFKRRQRFVGQLPGQGDRDSRDGPTDAFDQLPGKATDENSEDALIDLLRGALIQTFARCDPEDLLILRLVGVFGVSQERVAKMWNCSQSKISRIISNLEGWIQEETLAEIRRADPWLELEWADFVRLCQSSSEIFRINEPFP